MRSAWSAEVSMESRGPNMMSLEGEVWNAWSSIEGKEAKSAFVSQGLMEMVNGGGRGDVVRTIKLWASV